MTSPTPIRCTDLSAVQMALREGHTHELYHCLLHCFNQFWRSHISKESSPEMAEDIFWHAAEALDRKSRREKINLTATLCTFFNGFVPFFWLKDRTKHRKKPAMKPLDDELEFYADPNENALLSIYRKEETEAMQRCIARLADRERLVVEAYCQELKDEEIMHQIGYTDRKGVSVFRSRVFQKIRKLLEAEGFAIPSYQKEQP